LFPVPGVFPAFEQLKPRDPRMERFSLEKESMRKILVRRETGLTLLQTIDTTKFQVTEQELIGFFSTPLYRNTPMDRTAAQWNGRDGPIRDSLTTILRKNIYYLSHSVEQSLDLVIDLTQHGVITLPQKDDIVSTKYETTGVRTFTS
jgi:hypothetical protein